VTGPDGVTACVAPGGARIVDVDISGLGDRVVARARWCNGVFVFGTNPETARFEVTVSADGGANRVDLETVCVAGAEVQRGRCFVTLRPASMSPPTSHCEVRWPASDIGAGAGGRSGGRL